MLFFVILTSVVSLVLGDGCLFDLSQLTPEPLLLTETYQFLYPPLKNTVNNKSLVIERGQTVIIACPGGHVLTGEKSTPSSIYASCTQDSKLMHESTILNYTKIKCSNERLDSVKSTSNTCGISSRIVLIGYEIGLHVQFVPLITVCFDYIRQTPVWTNYYISGSIGHHEVNTAPLVYHEDSSIYNRTVNLTELYDVENARKTVNTLVGLPEDSHQFIDYHSFNMVRLAHPQAFVYRTQINATSHYLNTVPQWFLEGGVNNWERTETSVVLYAKLGKLDLDIYTGVYGVSHIKNADKGEQSIYMKILDEKTRKCLVPVPELLWKLVYNPLTRKAAVFLTINNPYQTNHTAICDDISPSFYSWLSWQKRTDPFSGFSYACTYHAVSAYIPSFPRLDVQGVLD